MRKLFVSASAWALAQAGLATGAPAQTTPPAAAEAESDEIVVTARFREERLQDVSQSIAAISGEDLEQRGVDDLKDIANATPGLDLVDRGPSRKAPNIRGVGRLVNLDDFIQSAPTVGLYLDDVPYSTSFANQRDVPSFDLANVQVLRGPQGTLYGEGSMAGTIKFETRAPDASAFEVRALGTLSTTEDGGVNYAINGALNVPLVTDRLALRVVGFYDRDRGFIDRRVTGQLPVEDANDSERYGGRVLLRAELSDGFNAQLGAYYDRTDAGASWVATFGLEDNLINDVRPGPEDRKDVAQLYSLRLNYETDFGTFTSITGLYDRENDFLFKDIVSSNIIYAATPLGGLPPKTSPLYAQLAFTNRGHSEEENRTQELRFVSDFAGPFQLTLGAYYKDSDSIISSFFSLPPGPALLDFDVIASGRQYAVFGEASHAFSEQFTVRLGARYFNEKLTTRTPFRAPAAQAALTFPPQRNTIDAVLPRVTLEYKPSEGLLFYVSAAAGARNGGFNSPFVPFQENAVVARINSMLPPGVPPIPPTFTDPNAASTFDKDDLWTYEIGAKTSLFDDRLTLNASAYYTDWNDLQVRLLTPVAGIALFGNVGKARIYGGELEALWRVTDAFSLSAGLALNDAKTDEAINYRSAVPQLGLPDLVVPAGSQIPGARDVMLTVGADYERLAFGDWSIVANASYSWMSSTVNELAFDPSTAPAGFDNSLPSYGLLNLRAGIRNERWSITAFVDNLTNEIEAQGLLPRSAETYVNRPRTIGLTVAADF